MTTNAERLGTDSQTFSEERPHFTEPILHRTTIDSGLIFSAAESEAIPSRVDRELQDLAADLGSGWDVVLPRVFAWRVGDDRLLTAAPETAYERLQERGAA
jgi:hypothetical protein